MDDAQISSFEIITKKFMTINIFSDKLKNR